MKQGACIILTRATIGPTDILAVFNREGMLGLPGGSVEPGEHPQRAAERELLEETGLRVKKWGDPLEPVEDDNGVLTHGFRVLNVSGALKTEMYPDGRVKNTPAWVRVHHLLTDRARFPKYNRWALEKWL